MSAGDDLAHLADWYPRRHAVERLSSRASRQLPAKWLTGEQPNPKAGYKSIFTDSVVADVNLFSDKGDLALFSTLGTFFSGGGGAIFGTCGTGIVGLVTSGFTQVSHAAFAGFFLYGAAGGALLGSGVGGIAVIATGVKSLRNRTGLHARENEALSTWLSARYGLVLSEVALVQLRTGIYQRCERVPFEDATGNKHVLSLDAESKTWFVQPPEVAAAMIPANPEVSVEPTAEVFSGEAASLHAHLAQQLAALTVASLTTEQAHVLARVRQDLDATITLCKRLEPLGGLDEDQQRQVTHVLTELSAEVREVGDEVRAQVSRELSVQQRYLIDRRRHQAPTANELLTLPQASSIDFEIANQGVDA